MLLSEINAFSETEDPNEMQVDKTISDWEKTSMKSYIEIFDKFKLGLDLEYKKVLIQKRTDDEMKLQF